MERDKQERGMGLGGGKGRIEKIRGRLEKREILRKAGTERKG